MPPVAANRWACKADVKAVRNAKMAARVIRWRRGFIYGCGK
jgi:hypothetical protein